MNKEFVMVPRETAETLASGQVSYTPYMEARNVLRALLAQPAAQYHENQSFSIASARCSPWMPAALWSRMVSADWPGNYWSLRRFTFQFILMGRRWRGSQMTN